MAAPWAKAGFVSVNASNPFLSAEGRNNYIVWNNAPAGSPVTKPASADGVMEGSIDLASAFGFMPPVVYVAACAYRTADGGALAHIAPAGSGPNLDPTEFLALPTIAFKDANGDGLFDRRDPNLEFRSDAIAA